MRSALLLTFAATALTQFATAQTTDVGLTMDGGMLTVIFGQDCGPVGCQPFPGGSVGRGQTRSLTVWAAPATPYLILVGLPGPCLPIPGIDNPLLLSTFDLTILGFTSAPPFVPTPCQQGTASEPLTIPLTVPPGLVFRAQVLGFGSGNVLALGPAIEATVV